MCLGEPPRFWIALLVAPLAAPILLVIIALSVGMIHFRFTENSYALISGFFLVGLVLSYGAMMLAGLPYILMLRRLHQFSLVMLSVGTWVIGAVAAVLLVLVIGKPHSLLIFAQLLLLLLLGGIMGLAVGVVFYVLSGTGEVRVFDSPAMKTSALCIASFLTAVACSYYLFIVYPERRDVSKFCSSLTIGARVANELEILRTYPGLRPGLRMHGPNSAERGVTVIGRILVKYRWPGLRGCSFSHINGVVTKIEMWQDEDT